MGEALTKLAAADDTVEQAQFNAAINAGLLGQTTLLDDQLRKQRMDDFLAGALDHWCALDPEHRRQKINAALLDLGYVGEDGAPADDAPDPFDAFYNDDGSILDVRGLNMTGTLNIVSARRSALRMILTIGNAFTDFAGVLESTGLTYLGLNGGSFGGKAIDVTPLKDTLEVLNLHAGYLTVTGVDACQSLMQLDLTLCTVAGELDLSSASSLAAASLNRVSGLTSVIFPTGISNIGLQQNIGCMVPDLDSCNQLAIVSMRQNHWSTAQVDALLASIVASGSAGAGNNLEIREPYETDGGYTNAHPSDAGLADVATLEDRGWGVAAA